MKNSPFDLKKWAEEYNERTEREETEVEEQKAKMSNALRIMLQTAKEKADDMDGWDETNDEMQKAIITATKNNNRNKWKLAELYELFKSFTWL